MLIAINIRQLEAWRWFTPPSALQLHNTSVNKVKYVFLLTGETTPAADDGDYDAQNDDDSSAHAASDYYNYRQLCRHCSDKQNEWRKLNNWIQEIAGEMYMNEKKINSFDSTLFPRPTGGCFASDIGARWFTFKALNSKQSTT